MDFSPLDPARIAVLMGFGGLFALAGLWLILRPKTDGYSAKIELFGMKFERSSAGLLVFLIGAAFLASPLSMPGDEPADARAAAGSGAAFGSGSGANDTQPREADVSGDEADGGQVRTAAARPAAVATTAPRALTAVGTEIEPNDNIAEANEIPVGSVIHGEVEAGNLDFYTFTFPEGFVGRFTVNLSGDTRFSDYDDLGGKFRSGMRGHSREVDAPRYYVSVGKRERRAGYTFSVAAREE